MPEMKNNLQLGMRAALAWQVSSAHGSWSPPFARMTPISPTARPRRRRGDLLPGSARSTRLSLLFGGARSRPAHRCENRQPRPCPARRLALRQRACACAGPSSPSRETTRRRRRPEDGNGRRGREYRGETEGATLDADSTATRARPGGAAARDARPRPARETTAPRPGGLAAEAAPRGRPPALLHSAENAKGETPEADSAPRAHVAGRRGKPRFQRPRAPSRACSRWTL